MRIFLSCQQSLHRYPIPAYDFWAYYFRNGLQEAGHHLQEDFQIDWAKGLMPLSHAERAAWKAETWTRTVDFIRDQNVSGKVDLFLSYLYPQQIDEGAIKQIRRMGIPCVNFFCDNVREFRRLPEEFSVFDLHWVPEFKALRLYKERRWATVPAPMPCWVPPSRRVLPQRENPVVSFIGGRDSLRADLLARAAVTGLPLEIRGPGWISSGEGQAGTPFGSSPGQRISSWIHFLGQQGIMAAGRRVFSRFRKHPSSFDFAGNVHPMPNQEDYLTILAESAVSLGINRYPSFRHPSDRPDTYSRLRDIEAPMLGACYLTEWTEGLDEMYHLGSEIATYRSAEELVENARRLLSDKSCRLEMRRKGQQRALAELSVGKTMEKICAALKIDPSTNK